MTTTTPNKGSITYASAVAGDSVAAGVTKTYDIDMSAALYGGLIMVRITPAATLTTGALAQLLESDEQSTATFFDLGVDWTSGLVSGQAYDSPWVITPQARKVRVSIKNQDATNGITVFVWSTTYTSVSTA